MTVVTIERKVLERNDAVAAENRALFARRRQFAINLVSAPGAGKTTLIERTIERIAGRARMGVVEGDVQTDLDAQRVARCGVPAVQIVTNGGCHLEARLVQDALASLDPGLELVVIENVGNLVCPANYDLGEAATVVVLSTTEGEDKPLKYPAMFRRASVLVVNKMDLLPYVPCDVAALERHARQINPDLLVFETSATTGAGLDAWCDWLVDRVRQVHA